jgi:hypothetical protein
MGLKTHSIFPLLLQYLQIGYINLYTLHTFKHFNLVDGIAFLNRDSFKKVSINRQFFWQALCANIEYFKNIFMGFRF